MIKQLLIAPWVAAAALTVPVLAADIPTSNTCALADAIRAAESDSAVAGCPAGNGTDRILLDRDVTLLAVDNSDPLYGDTGLPVISTNITIVGNGHVIERNPSAPPFRIFRVTGGLFGDGKLILDNVELRGGLAGAPGVAVVDCLLTAVGMGGGGLVQGGILDMTNSVVAGNEAHCGGGFAILHGGRLQIWDSLVGGATANAAFYGGAIFNFGSGADGSSRLEARDTLFLSNEAHSLADPLTFPNSSGGAIYNAATATLVDSTFADNKAGCGGAISNQTFNGQLEVVGTTLRDNIAAAGGALHVYNASDAMLANSTLAGNRQMGFSFPPIYSCSSTLGATGGGAVNNSNSADLTLLDSLLADNTADQDGGAIVNGQNGRLSIRNTRIENNTADRNGGGISAESVNGAVDSILENVDVSGNISQGVRGGGLDLSNLPITIRGSRILDNYARDGIGMGGGMSYRSTSATVNPVRIEETTVDGNHSGDGGGIYNDHGDLTIIQSTISRNESVGPFTFGAGIMNDDGGTMTIVNSTVSGNYGEFVDGAGVRAEGVRTTIINSTIARNSGSSQGGLAVLRDNTVVQNTIIGLNTATSGDGTDNCQVVAALVDNGGNLQTDGSCPLTFTQVTEAQLGLAPLSDNGGPTLTHPLLPGSAAIGFAGAPCPPETADQDQRGVARGQLCDSGAYTMAAELPRLSFLQADSWVWENAGLPATVGVELDNTSGSLSVGDVTAFLTIRGSAANGFDYNETTARPVVIPMPAPGTRTVVDVEFFIIDDLLQEGDETIDLTLTLAGPAGLGALTTHRLVIFDDETDNACSQAQDEVQSTVGDLNPSSNRDHGQQMKRINQILRDFERSNGELPVGCRGCIVSQFARGVRIVDQAACQSTDPQ